MPADAPSDPVLIVQIEVDAMNSTSGTSAGYSPRPRKRWAWVFLAGTAVTGLILLKATTTSLVDPPVPYMEVWNTNDPPVAMQGGETVASSHDRETSKKARLASSAAPDAAVTTLPEVPVTNDTVIPALEQKTGLNLHAAELLICRESVVNFVINATDGKDECDGLKKAFDKTCSNNENDDDESHRRKLQHRTRRTMWEKTRKTLRWHAFLYETYRWLYWSAKQVFTQESPFFFAEEELTEETWDDACYLVENNLDRVVHEDLIRRWKLERAYHARHRRRLEQVASNKTNSKALSQSLSLPTSKQHLSQSTLSETLMLQQGDKIIEKATNQSQAATDAASSSKAMKESSAAVSALLNDPSSVEARTCCASILNVYHDHCSIDPEEDVSDSRLVFVIFVMACCGVVKSLIRHFRILWLPEAAGCIIVGVLSGYLIMLFPHNDISFEGNWFLRILVPPIVFEAALGIDKRSFNRHVVPIILYAFIGTLIATVLTAMIVHRGSLMLAPFCTPIPYVEALTFGALISSIDPIAVLSVLSNMGMTDTDTIYVVIFGESLLNDGVAIVLFETLVHFLDEDLVIDGDAVFAASIHFLVVAIGSLLVGVGSGMLSTVYFWLFHGCQTALVEVLMFFCWALLPYYVCDGIGWSGIVSAVATGFVMDLYVVGEKEEVMMDNSEHDSSPSSPAKTGERAFAPGRYRIFSGAGHLSEESRTHIGFVTEMISTVMETAIFAYLGLFLFSHRYHWNFFHTVLAIFACCVSRAVMIPSLSLVANAITRLQQTRAACRKPVALRRTVPNAPAGVVIDVKMQVVLWFAGLRGAMSFALVEHIPMYDDVSGEGTRLKPELKAMTSATILFTVFILGGYTYYVMEHLGLAPSANPRKQSPVVFGMDSLISKSRSEEDEDDSSSGTKKNSSSLSKKSAFRQRHTISDVGGLS